MDVSEKPCLFCHLDHRVVCDGRLWIAIDDAFPVNQGHMLIIPRRHVASFREITVEEFIELHDMVTRVTGHLDAKFRPTGYNFGVNDGESAGQTIFHVHFHVIPRFDGDTENPRGGVRKVKPALVPYDG